MKGGLAEQIEILKKIQNSLGVSFKFLYAYGAESWQNCVRVPPPFGMRSMYQEWNITAQV